MKQVVLFSVFNCSRALRKVPQVVFCTIKFICLYLNHCYTSY